MARRTAARLPYETPELSPVPTSVLNRPPGMARRPGVMPMLGRHRVADLVARFGSPLYVIDEDAMRAAFRRMLGAFRAGWPDTQIGYSVKTNYLSAIVALFRSEGALGEVVSGFEYSICRDLGIPGTDIIFNGPWKTDDELRRAFAEGAQVNLDGDDELARAIAISRTLSKPARIGLRVSMKLNYPPWDKFGFGLEGGHAIDSARLVAREKNLILDGLHLHVGTYVPDPALYARGAEALIALTQRLDRELKITINHLDLGGGYATRNTLRGALLPGEATAAAPEDYAEAVTAQFRAAKHQFEHPPRLIIEPGRAVVDEGMSIVSRVCAVKRTSSGGKAAIIDAGVHILPTAYWYNHEICPVLDRGQAIETYKLAGPLCMQIDVVRESINLPSLKFGDLLVIKDVGAYNYTQSMQFIQLRPPVLMLSGDDVHVVREPEHQEYVREPERLPPHLVNAETRASVLVQAAAARAARGATPE